MTMKPQADWRDAKQPWQVALVSATVLILELALIRLVPAEVRAISYFTNLILMASFFGLGLGCILHRQRSLALLLPIGLAMVLLFVGVGKGIVIYAAATEVHYWLPAAAPLTGVALHLPLLEAALLAFVLVAVPFVALGQALARSMDAFPRLTAYAWDIGGSLAGTLAFALGSWYCLPPWAWLLPMMLIWAVVMARGLALQVCCAAVAIIAVVATGTPHEARWSPYYLIQHRQSPAGLVVWVNSSFHQFAFDFTQELPEAKVPREEALAKWNRPYGWYREAHAGAGPGRVLVLGAGTGNDIKVALLNGAEAVVAVEIDPLILQLGRELNPTQPYADPRVQAVVGDARHYLATSTETFDLIVFGTLDSQALLSGQANLRLENFVYTVESLRAARARLKPGGMLVVHYSVSKPWLLPRLYANLRTVFGEQSRLQVETSPLLFNATLVGANGLEGFRDTAENLRQYGGGTPSTDDWPFIYLQRRVISALYVKVFAVVLALVVGAFLVLRRLETASGLHLDFLFLGLGFTLVESSAVVRLALLFGSTWTVNAVVFAAVLLTIFLANWAVLKGRAPPLRLAWCGVLLFVLVNFLLPTHWLAGLASGPRLLACGLLVGLPVFCAAVCFSRLFQRQAATGYALGVNLIGAMAGGTLEYASMALGLRAVWLIALAIYALAWLASELAAKRRLTAPGAAPA